MEISIYCKKCRKRVCWIGKMVDCPRCKCGYLPERSVLEEADKELEPKERIIDGEEALRLKRIKKMGKMH